MKSIFVALCCTLQAMQHEAEGYSENKFSLYHRFPNRYHRTKLMMGTGTGIDSRKLLEKPIPSRKLKPGAPRPPFLFLYANILLIIRIKGRG